jgi:hypothetical protein
MPRPKRRRSWRKRLTGNLTIALIVAACVGELAKDTAWDNYSSVGWDDYSWSTGSPPEEKSDAATIIKRLTLDMPRGDGWYDRDGSPERPAPRT